MEKQIICPVCNSNALADPDYRHNRIFYECPVCGRFELLPPDSDHEVNKNHLASYLFYNCFNGSEEYRYHTLLDKETCDKYRAAFDQSDITHGRPVHMDAEIVENWYPKTFSERVDRILLYLSEHTAHMGQLFTFNYQEALSLMFIDRKEAMSHNEFRLNNTDEVRDENDCKNELRYIVNCLWESSYVDYNITENKDRYLELRLKPKGYSRIDELQKYRTSGHNALVAMKFGEDTKPLREAIRAGIKDIGYHAIFIDEVQHNDFITPELLKYIRDSKFVVVDLTHQNNGAYFEEGYAMGLGKPVIQLCKTGVQLHFDIAQKNTIMWDNEDDIPQRLCNRIKATID